MWTPSVCLARVRAGHCTQRALNATTRPFACAQVPGHETLLRVKQEERVHNHLWVPSGNAIEKPIDAVDSAAAARQQAQAESAATARAEAMVARDRKEHAELAAQAALDMIKMEGMGNDGLWPWARGGRGDGAAGATAHAARHQGKRRAARLQAARLGRKARTSQQATTQRSLLTCSAICLKK